MEAQHSIPPLSLHDLLGEILPVFKREVLIAPGMVGFLPVRLRHVTFRRYLSVGINFAFRISLATLAFVLQYLVAGIAASSHRYEVRRLASLARLPGFYPG